MDHGERLARVETALSSLAGTVNTMAGQVQEVRDHMLTTKGKSAGWSASWRLIGAIVVGTGTLGAGVGAIAAVLVR